MNRVLEKCVFGDSTKYEVLWNGYELDAVFAYKDGILKDDDAFLYDLNLLIGNVEIRKGLISYNSFAFLKVIKADCHNGYIACHKFTGNARFVEFTARRPFIGGTFDTCAFNSIYIEDDTILTNCKIEIMQYEKNFSIYKNDFKFMMVGCDVEKYSDMTKIINPLEV